MLWPFPNLNALRSVRGFDLMDPKRSARLATQRPAIPEPISLDDGDTESIFSTVCETCNQPENSGSLQHFPCCDCIAHRACVDDGVDAICPFCKMDLRERLQRVPAVHCPLCRGPVDPQGCGPEAVHVFPCCLRSLFHLRCLATSIPKASDGSEVRLCPEGVRSHVDVEWLERQCHINGVEFPSKIDWDACTIHFAPLLPSTVTCHLPRPLTFLLAVQIPFCNQSLAEFAKSGSFLASSVFHGCVVDVDVSPTNRGINALVLNLATSMLPTLRPSTRKIQ